jgi:uncharacterized protein YegL
MNKLMGWMTAAALAASPAHAVEMTEGAPAERPTVEVVFVLDTTGSMGGLLDGAKQRVWAIANEIAKGKPAPRVRMGLVAFRDKGDDYVTKVTDLSDNLDRTYKDLSALTAGGGGDGPEHVIAGLDDAVDKIGWSKDPKTFKVVYLVGDAQPHEDYADAPKLTAVLEKAVRKGLIINALQCGADAATTLAFTKVARLGEGRFMPVAQDGGAVAVATPFDARLAEASGKLEGTLMAYGGAREEAAADMALASSVRGLARAAAPAAAAERAVYKAREGFSSDKDLARAVAEKKVDLAKLKNEELPEELRGLSLEQKRARLERVEADRKALRDEVAALTGKRDAWIKKELASKPKDSFDAKLVDALKFQAAKKGIRY